LSGLGRVWNRAAWLDALRSVLRAWKSHHASTIVAVIVVIWLVSGTALHFAERDTNPEFKTFNDSLWNVWVTLFSGLNSEPKSHVGRLVVSIVLVVGVALAGLFTASVASILIERALRRREVSTLEMSDHLVLCNWSPRVLEWIREVHSGIVTDPRPVVIVHDTPDEVVLPDKRDEAAFNDVYIVKGDPANEVILRRAKAAQAHSVVIMSDDRDDRHDARLSRVAIGPARRQRDVPGAGACTTCRDGFRRSGKRVPARSHEYEGVPSHRALSR